MATKQRDMNSEIAKAIARYQQRLAEQAEMEALQRPVVSNQPSYMSPEQQARLAKLQEQERLRNYEPSAWNPNTNQGYAPQAPAPQVEYPPQVNADNGMVQAPPREAPAPVPQAPVPQYYNDAYNEGGGGDVLARYAQRKAEQEGVAPPSAMSQRQWGDVANLVRPQNAPPAQAPVAPEPVYAPPSATSQMNWGDIANLVRPKEEKKPKSKKEVEYATPSNLSQMTWRDFMDNYVRGENGRKPLF